MRSQFLSHSFGVLIATVFCTSSCKEPLPQYQDPREVFDSYQWGAYAISRTENEMKAYFTVVNAYDETFDAAAIFNGTLVITYDRDPSFKKTVQLTPSSLLYARGYNPVSGHLRFDPGDSVRLGFSWNFLGDDGRSLFDIVPFVRDPECPARFLSAEPVRMTFRADVRIYERTETVTAPLFRFAFVLHREYVDPRAC